MRYAVAIWNYTEPGVRLAELVREFVGFGFDTISFVSGQFGAPEGAEMQEAVELVHAQGLKVTVHGAFEFGAQGAQTVIDLFGDALLAITFDPISEVDSCGSSFATGRMAAVLGEILRRSEGSGLQVAVEDIPLDARALDRYRADLEPLLESGRYGMLLDVGHMNLRQRQWSYFAGQSVADYIGRIPVPIIEAHLHDNLGQGDSHGHFGYGNIDLAAVAEGLKSVGFDGVSTVEIAPSFHDSTPAESKPHARASLEQWRSLMDRG